ncbi:hypothetical protein [Euzebya sp.]|uniref:hypothetical protein n=1 Tax=Euzebya sp. TaxID=1971409 RepID=UPI0035180D11
MDTLQAQAVAPRDESDRQVLTLHLDDRCRALARVLALVEGRGLIVGELRFSPATTARPHALATVEVSGPADRLDTVISRIESLPSVRRALVGRPVAVPL